MATNTPTGAYPFSTQESTAIPLDIIEGLGVLVVAFTAATPVEFTIPDGYLVGTITASEACVVKFGDSLTTIEDNTLIEDAIFVPQDATVTCALTPGDVSVLGLIDDGTIVIQLIRKWNALNFNTQFTKK